MHCNRYRESFNTRVFRSEPAAICVDSCHLVLCAMCLGPVGDAFSQRLGTTSVANLGNHSRHSCGLDGYIRSQSAFSYLGGSLAEHHWSVPRSVGRLVLLRVVDHREYCLQAPDWIEFCIVESIIGETSLL